MVQNIQPHRRPSSIVLPEHTATATFNFLMALPGRTSSPHTQRAYFRWVDTYLVDIAGQKPTNGDERIHRMSALPIQLLQSSISAVAHELRYSVW